MPCEEDVSGRSVWIGRYIVHSDGRILNQTTGLPVRMYPGRNGILYLRMHGKKRTASHVVLEAFGLPRDRGCVTGYRDGDTTNLTLDNLYWRPSIQSIPSNRVDDDRRARVIQLDRDGHSQKAIGQLLRLHPSTVSRILDE